MYDNNYTPVGLPFEKDQIKLAKFLRANFPEQVSKNERKPLAQSGAVELAIELLTEYKAHLTPRVADASPLYCKKCGDEMLNICSDCAGDE